MNKDINCIQFSPVPFQRKPPERGATGTKSEDFNEKE